MRSRALIVSEMGKPLAEARGEATYAAEFLRWFSEEAVRANGDYAVAPSGANRMLVAHAPIGIALLITPWNFPAAMATRKIGPALAAGCTVVLKPAEETPLTAIAIARLLDEAGVPEGVVNVVCTDEPAPLAEAILSDARVRKLSFTGSTAVGRRLLELCAPRVISASMELGGNSPFVVLAGRRPRRGDRRCDGGEDAQRRRGLHRRQPLPGPRVGRRARSPTGSSTPWPR